MKSPSKETPLHAMLFGGNQERGFRPGTENTGMIAGLGEAAQLVVDKLETYSSHMRKVRYRWIHRGVQRLLHPSSRCPPPPKIIPLCSTAFKGVSSSSIFMVINHNELNFLQI